MQKSITFKNANISFSDVGKGTAVVLLHGFLENSTMWKDVIPPLSKRNRVIAIDLLGHGKTDCLGYVHSMEVFAASIQAVLQHLKIRKYILVGHSLGGYISLEISKTNSNQIKGLCLVNSTSNEDSKDRKNLRIRANKMIQNNFTNMVRMSFSNLFGEESKIQYKEALASALKEALKTPLQGYIAGQEGMRIRENTQDVLRNNSFKKLLIVGKQDPVLDFKTSMLEAEETNSEIIVFPSGHMSHIENKEALVTALKDFVKTCL